MGDPLPSRTHMVLDSLLTVYHGKLINSSLLFLIVLYMLQLGNGVALTQELSTLLSIAEDSVLDCDINLHLEYNFLQ